MTLREVQKILEAEVVADDNLDSTEVEVLMLVKDGSLLLTGLTNPQVVRTAEMANVKAVCFVRGKKPQPETIDLAASCKLPLLLTDLPMFESCGRLYREGLTGCSEKGT